MISFKKNSLFISCLATFIIAMGCSLKMEKDRFIFDNPFEKKCTCEEEKIDVEMHFGPGPNSQDGSE